MNTALRILVFCLLAQPALAAEKWLSVQSKNFLLVGNAAEPDIRRVGRFLEEYRKSFGLVFPKVEQNVSAPTTVLVFRNEALFKPYKPANPSAQFQAGDDVNYVAVAVGSPISPAALHEYAHVIIRENTGTIPLWVTEGLAETFSMFEATKRQNEFLLGMVPMVHSVTFKDTALLPLKTFFEQDRGSFHYNEKTRQGVFYAQSWALIHYLLLGPNNERRQQLAQFMQTVSAATASEDAFVQAFQTDYSTLQDELRDYLRRPVPTLKLVSNQDLQIDVRAMNAKTLTEAEVEYYLGDFLLHTQRVAEAEVHLKNAISKDPKLTAAQVSLAMLRTSQKNYAEAMALLKSPVEAEPKNYLYNFYSASVLQRMEEDGAAGSDSGERREVLRAHLNKSIDAAPRFLPAQKMLAAINIASGELLAQTENLLKKALGIAPGREDLRILLAETYLKAHRTADASVLLTDIERVTQDPNTRRRSRSILDELAATRPVFTEILPEVPKPTEEPRVETPLPPAPAPTNARETVLQPLTPIGPNVEGQKLTGLLVELECTNGLTLRVRTETTTAEFHSSQPDNIQFLSYTSNVSNNIQCGPRNPGIPVAITYRPVPGGAGDPLVVEFIEKKE